MSDPKPPDIDWNNVATELRAARWKEREDWGDFDEELAARYLAGLATPEERAQVERQSREFECVRQLLEQTRQLEAPQASQDLPTEGGASAHEKSAWAPRPSAGSPLFHRRFLAALSAAAMVLLLALGGLTSWIVLHGWEIHRLARELDRDRVDSRVLQTQIAEMQRRDAESQATVQADNSPPQAPRLHALESLVSELERDRLLQRELVAELSRSIETLEKTVASYERNRDKPVRLTSDAANRPVGWNDMLREFYRKDKLAETVVRDLFQVGGDQVRDEIKRLRETDPEPTPEQILDALFRLWGGPKDEEPR